MLLGGCPFLSFIGVYSRRVQHNKTAPKLGGVQCTYNAEHYSKTETYLGVSYYSNTVQCT